MRRFSFLLAAALLVISAGVVYTLQVRLAKSRKERVQPTPAIKVGLEGVAPGGWRYTKTDGETGKPIVRVDATEFEGTHDPSTFELKGMALRLYSKTANTYTYVTTDRALFDEGSGLMKSQAQVYIVMNVPNDKDAASKDEAEKRVQVTTSGLTYETQTGKAHTDQAASFQFTQGDGQGVGADYDPNTKVLHLKSQVSLDWIGKGPAQNKIHIEAGDLVYKEPEHRIYLSPWSKMQRLTTTLEARNTVVQLDDGRLHQIDGEHPFGTDKREDRATSYAADKMTAMFDEDGNLLQILGTDHARITSAQPAAKTVVTGDKADLRFAISNKQVGKDVVSESQLHLVMADGHAIAESTPLPQPGVKLPETRILRSEHIEMEMKPGGKDLQEIRTSTKAQLEFKPNRADQAHRVIDASHLRVLYGGGSYVDSLLAWDAVTHTDKAVEKTKVLLGPDGKPEPAPPAITWSDQLTAKFTPNSNQVALVEQTGNFRYEEGTRKASAKRAVLEQSINRITLTGDAHVLDNTGSASAERIITSQNSGDMDAIGHVLSTHEPDRNEKPGTSMLDATEAMQAEADAMQTRDNNSQVFYEGHAVIWQGANRISADSIVINRDQQSLAASGNVVSELVDNRKQSGPAITASAKAQRATPSTDPGAIYTVVHAPALAYHDDTRIATYTGGVKLLREKMTITSKELQAYLSPKSDKPNNDSSLERALANGEVIISDVISPGRTRVGSAEHAEYFTKQDKVLLNGGAPQMVDSYKGTTKGEQLTYFSNQDHMIVDGQKTDPAFTKLKKK